MPIYVIKGYRVISRVVFYLQIVVLGRDEGWLMKTCAHIRNKGVQSYIKSCVLFLDCCIG